MTEIEHLPNQTRQPTPGEPLGFNRAPTARRACAFRSAFNPSTFMRSTLRYTFTVFTLAALVVAGSACRTSKQTGPESQGRLFLERADYDRRIERAVGDVLDEHRFFIPWLVLQGSESSLWFVSERFHSLTDFERVFVHITKGNEVHVEIQHREIALSDWHFGDGDRFLTEAEVIRKNIQDRLSEDTLNARQ
jgi:hypothetical protein